MRLRMLLVTVVSTVCVVAASLAAYADTVTFHDPRADAQVRYDLTVAHVTNSQQQLTVSTGVRDLRAAGTQIFGFSITPARGDAYYMLTAVRRSNGKVSSKLVRYGSNGEPIRVACRIHPAWKVGRDQIRTELPRRCIAEEGTVAVALYLGAGNGHAGDPADWTKSVRVGQS